ncbi:DUF1835 domain-containing protein [Tenacibaculum pacificus]|uniref:DUF1835 domain-containing protein n=1 Tax=Tenacibaculum pacificus TaxID=3018314 RepID=UPI0022F40684|nr:DUF1835 domain-containing protein [Tenacibaculum pacificus]WBX74729.1 DUF1835 domain-containing protein [Tenacibaculum pacificus]
MISLKLHITNGDTTSKKLEELNFEGKKITWREILCEGKTTTDVGSKNFWKNRFNFFKTYYRTSKQKFLNYTVKEYRALCNEKNQDEIVLWFDYDLLSQINMIALVSWLKRHRKGCQISLVSTEKINNKKSIELNTLSDNQLRQHYINRSILSQNDIEYADYIWQLYCSDNPLQLENAVKLHTNSTFKHLNKALKNHLQRFPSLKNGLNLIENSILKTINKNEFKNKNQLINNLSINHKNYGFLNNQYFNKMKILHKLFTSLNPITLTKAGKGVLAQQTNYYGKIRTDFSYLGGAKKYSYLYVNSTDKLLKITS